MKKLVLILFVVSIITLFFTQQVYNQKYAKCISKSNNIVYTRASIDTFLVYKIDPKLFSLEFYYKDDSGKIMQNIGTLKTYMENQGKALTFATNGGMYMVGGKPLGLFIQDNKVITPMNRKKGNGNFYSKPNGVFYIDLKNNANICITENCPDYKSIKHATQSGPMLVVNNELTKVCNPASNNYCIRSGVGVTANNKVIFAISIESVTFYSLGQFFKNAGCVNALYLDGSISEMYLPKNGGTYINNNFGVIIASYKNK